MTFGIATCGDNTKHDYLNADSVVGSNSKSILEPRDVKRQIPAADYARDRHAVALLTTRKLKWVDLRRL